MKIYTTAPLEDPRDARTVFPQLEAIGYDGAFTFEAKHDPFLPLVLAAERTRTLRLGTAIAIVFARNPMNLANLAYGLQSISGGRFLLGLGSQVRPHIHLRNAGRHRRRRRSDGARRRGSAQTARLLRIDARLPLYARLPRLG